MRQDHEHSLRGARAAADRDDLAAWVAGFLASPGSDNAVLAEELAGAGLAWLGPVRIPLRRLHRLAGPEGQPVLCVVDDDDWRDDVEQMKEQIEEGWEPPPLVVRERDGRMVVEDGNHRIESLRRAGDRSAWCVVGFDDDRRRDAFARQAGG